MAWSISVLKQNSTAAWLVQVQVAMGVASRGEEGIGSLVLEEGSGHSVLEEDGGDNSDGGNCNMGEGSDHGVQDKDEDVGGAQRCVRVPCDRYC